jgi:P2 family phage contractile tail tube protein
MPFAKKLKDIRLYNEAYNYQGVIAEMTIPKIVALTEDWRAGGMLGPMPIFHGIETPEFEWTLGGHDDLVVTQAGLMQHDGLLLRAIGAFQDESNGSVSTVEAVMRGRHSELDFGTWKPGEDTEEKVKTVCSYYKMISNGRELFEIDMLNGIFRVGGIDRWSEIRAALGG